MKLIIALIALVVVGCYTPGLPGTKVMKLSRVETNAVVGKCVICSAPTARVEIGVYAISESGKELTEDRYVCSKCASIARKESEKK